MPKLHPDVVFFDYGKTLASETDDRFRDISSYVAQHGLVLDKEKYARGREAAEAFAGAYRRAHGYRAYLADRYWYGFCREFLIAAFGSDAAQFAEPMHQVQFYRNEVYPETIATLKELTRRGYRLGVISNWEAPTLHGQFERFGMTPYFVAVLPSRDAEAGKPHPRIFELARMQLGVRPDRAVHVGDSWRCDVEGAIAAGMTPVWLDRDGDERAPDRSVRRIGTLDGLLDILA